METIQPIIQSTQPVRSNPKNPYKILFFISLGLFLIVSSVLITLLLTQNKSNSLTTPDTSKTVSTTVTKITPTVSQITPTITESEIPSGWKTYTDSTYKFSINYPSDWTLSKTAEGFSLISSKMAKKVAEAGDEPTVFGPEIEFSIYNSLSKLSGSTEIKTLKEYVSSDLKNLEEVSINGVSGYSGYTDYPSHYIYLQKNNIFVRVFDGVNLKDSDYNNSEIKI